MDDDIKFKKILPVFFLPGFILLFCFLNFTDIGIPIKNFLMELIEPISNGEFSNKKILNFEYAEEDLGYIIYKGEKTIISTRNEEDWVERNDIKSIEKEEKYYKITTISGDTEYYEKSDVDNKTTYEITKTNALYTYEEYQKFIEVQKKNRVINLRIIVLFLICVLVIMFKLLFSIFKAVEKLENRSC